MILDRPKRRAETIVGQICVNNDEEPQDRIERFHRALKEAGTVYGFKGTGHGGYLARDRHLSVDCTVIITAIVHKEPLRSRWARALDKIRTEYGLELTWEETEVAEKYFVKPLFERTDQEYLDQFCQEYGIERKLAVVPLDHFIPPGTPPMKITSTTGGTSNLDVNITGYTSEPLRGQSVDITIMDEVDDVATEVRERKTMGVGEWVEWWRL
jgi:hypothetical protein